MIVKDLIELTGGEASGIPEVRGISEEGPTWVDGVPTDVERRNIEIIRRFWEAWKQQPFEPDTLREFLTPDAVIRTGWRGEHVCHGREEAVAGFVEEVRRQVEYDEYTDFKFPILVAKGPVVFHTWTWISYSPRIGYRFERPMAAIFLLRDGRIDRWDNYATGKESSPAYVGGNGPDGL